MTEADRAAFEILIAAMSDADLRHAAINADLESEESALLDGEAERRCIDL